MSRFFRAISVLVPVLFVISCSPEPVHDFLVTDAAGKSLPAYQKTKRAAGKEGLLEPAPAGSLAFACETAVSAGYSFRIDVSSNTLRSLVLTIEGKGTRLREVLPSEYSDFSYYVPLPSGFAMTGFSVEDTGKARPASSARIAAVEIAKRFVGLSASGKSVVLSKGIRIVRPAGNPAVVDRVSIDLGEAGIRADGAFQVRFGYRAEKKGAPGRFEARGGTKTAVFPFRAAAGLGTAVAYNGLFPEKTRTLDLIPPPGSTIVSLDVTQMDSADDPPTIDPGAILRYREASWRRPEFEVYRWARFPSILIFDTRDYAIQDSLFKRIAFFVEKKGYSGKLMADSDIATQHGWNAHDYRSEDLAAFFEKAEKERFPLNEQELECRDILIKAGIIRKTADGIAAGEGAIISISRESSDYLRSLFLGHESYHGIFFIDPEYRDFCKTVWKPLDPAVKDFIIYYFSYMRYNIADPYLIVNEFQAYFMQQPVPLIKDYFTKTIIERLEKAYPDRTESLNAFAEKFGDAFPEAEKKLSDFLAKKYGLPDGRTVQ
jgi:hypothetical protein